MVSKKLPYDTNGLPYDVYMGDSRPQCCYRKLFAYPTPTEVIPVHLSLVVNCFEVGSVDNVEVGVIEGLETMDV